MTKTKAKSDKEIEKREEWKKLSDNDKTRALISVIIKEAVKDFTYQKGYEQGKKDALEEVLKAFDEAVKERLTDEDTVFVIEGEIRRKLKDME